MGDYGLVLQSDPLSNAPPVIAQQPRSLTVRMDTFATLGVGAGGSSPLTYEWFKNGVAPCVGGNPNLYFDPVQRSNAGDYYVVVRNRFGSATSATARLTVVSDAPSVRIQSIGAARLTITGQSDVNYRIEYADRLKGTNTLWNTLTTFESVRTPFIWIDPESPLVSQRYYRVVQE